MDKKVIYYIIAGVVLIATIWIIIAMQGGSGKPNQGNVPATTTQVAKSEIDAANEAVKETGGVGLPLRITLDDNGQTISLTPGKNLVLMLGTDYNWTITSNNETVMAKRNVNSTDERIQAVYQASQAGKAVLTASGVCKTKTNCTDVSFKLNVESVITDNLTQEELMK